MYMYVKDLENDCKIIAKAPLINVQEVLEKGLNSSAVFVVIQETSTSSIEVGNFNLAPLPGCCGVVVSCYSYLTPMSRHTAIGKIFHEIKEAVAKEMGYSLMISTTDMTNVPQVVSASRAKWRFIDFFTNKRTGNKLGVAIKHI